MYIPKSKEDMHSAIGFELGAFSGGSVGAKIGTLILPGVGTTVGAIVGGVIGAVAGAHDKSWSDNARSAASAWNKKD